MADLKDASEFHRQVLINILQLLQGIEHLQSSGFHYSHVSVEHLVITENQQFLQILPHLHNFETQEKQKSTVEHKANIGLGPDSDSNLFQSSTTQQVGRLLKNMMKSSRHLINVVGSSEANANRKSTTSTSWHIAPETKFSQAIHCIIKHFESNPGLNMEEAVLIIQCALWGPSDLGELSINDVSPYTALELWIEMEQAKLVNNLAVLASTDKFTPSFFLKHCYFASITSQSLFDGLKVLERI